MSRSPLSQTVQRPARNNWRDATKRQILGNFTTTTDKSTTGENNGYNGYGSGSSSSQNKIDGNNADHIKLLIEGLQEKHDQMIAFLKSDLEDCKLEQEEALSTGLIKLPKAVRNMSVKDFNRQHHSCDLLALLKSKDGVVLQSRLAAAGGAATTGAASKNNTDLHTNYNNNTTEQQKSQAVVGNMKSSSAVLDANKKRCYETPLPRMRRPGAQMGTILRTARRGEGLYSQNGSPLAATEPGTVIATVCKKARRGNELTENVSANVEINVGEGQYISLNDPNGVSALDAQMKQTAASQLKVLQDQMASLMAQLQQ